MQYVVRLQDTVSGSKPTVSQKDKCVQEERICEHGAKDEGKEAKSEGRGKKRTETVAQSKNTKSSGGKGGKKNCSGAV